MPNGDGNAGVSSKQLWGAALGVVVLTLGSLGASTWTTGNTNSLAIVKLTTISENTTDALREIKTAVQNMPAVPREVESKFVELRERLNAEQAQLNASTERCNNLAERITRLEDKIPILKVEK